MGRGTHHQQQPGSNGIRDICKAYTCLFTKWHNQSSKKEREENSKGINEAYNGTQIKRSDSGPINLEKGKDEEKFKRSCSFLSRSSSKRSETPTSPAKPQMTKSASHSASRTSSIKRELLRSKSTRNDSQTSTFSRNLRHSGPVLWEEDNANQYQNQNQNSRFSRSESRGSGPTPIVFSHSAELKKKAPVIERSLECTLEELCNGCIKKIDITRDVISRTGQLQKEEETLQIKIKPGWKKGTKITFEEKGDSRPGTRPADITFTIQEQTHPLFNRNGDDLEVQISIPLLKALTGCSVSVPLLGGDAVELPLDDVVHPGFEKVVEGQGMPKPREEGKRGDLRVKFLVVFPTELSDEQREGAYEILKDCC